MVNIRLGQAASLEGGRPAADETALVAALKARSDSAWSEFYDRHYSLVYRYVLARTSDASAAEDLAASVFLEALRSINSYSFRGKPIAAWLYRIARNLVSDYHKLRRRRGERVDAEAAQAASRQSTVADAVDAAQMDLRDAVRSLKDSQREVLVLHYYLGLSLPEVAAMLGKKERAVYSLQARAIESLRLRLGARERK